MMLFVCTARSTRLTHVGTLFGEHVRRVFVALERAWEVRRIYIFLYMYKKVYNY